MGALGSLVSKTIDPSKDSAIVGAAVTVNGIESPGARTPEFGSTETPGTSLVTERISRSAVPRLTARPTTSSVCPV